MNIAEGSGLNRKETAAYTKHEYEECQAFLVRSGKHLVDDEVNISILKLKFLLQLHSCNVKCQYDLNYLNDRLT